MMIQEVSLQYLHRNVLGTLSIVKENHMDTDTTKTIGRLASFISLRDIKIRVYDSSGLSSDVSLSPVCAH